MRAKSDGVCQDCKTRVVMPRFNRQAVCFSCHSTNVTKRACALCEQFINVGDDVTWDRRNGTWEAHTQCWLNSSPEARERVIRQQQQKEREQQQEQKDLRAANKAAAAVVVEEEEVVVAEEEEEEVVEQEDNFKPVSKPVAIKNCTNFYDWVYLLIAARIHAYIYGPAGCGKSHIVEQAAHHFGLSFDSISLNVMTQPSALLGFMGLSLDGGKYVGTAFRQIWEFGGIFLIDEMDNASGNLLTMLNSGLANRFINFPDKTVTMHPDCVVISTGNTTGRGKTAQYIGRQTLDAATLDRFVYLSHNYDEALELRLAAGTAVEEETTGKVEYVPCVDSVLRTKWAKVIQSIRKNMKKHGLQTVVSMRPTITGCKLLNHADFSTLLEMLVFKGVDTDTRTKLMEGVYV